MNPTYGRPAAPPFKGGAAADQYLLQKINGASTEQLVALLLEGAQRFLGQALLHMERNDIPAKAMAVNRVSAIIEELIVWVNNENGGEVAANLLRIYDWWLNELFEGSQKNQKERLDYISRQMGEMRTTWMEVDQRSRGAAPVSTTLGQHGVVG